MSAREGAEMSAASDPGRLGPFAPGIPSDSGAVLCRNRAIAETLGRDRWSARAIPRYGHRAV